MARRKWGQRTWSPTSSGGGAAPTNGVSAQEALQIAYRPMPPSQTVEYEEDFGHNLMIHREFISKRHRDRMSFDMSALAYSEVELRRGRQHLAGVMNRERRGVSVGASAAPADLVQMQTDVDPNTREVVSARYLFNERRMQFCDRFQNFFRERLEREATDAQHLFSLMEACAVIYGCETDAAREAYFHMFLGLDLDTLEAEEEALRSRIAEAKLVQQTLTMESEEPGSDTTLLQHTNTASNKGSDGGSSNEDAIIASVPELSLFDDPDEAPQGAAGSSAAPRSAIQLPEEFEEYAPLYKAYLAHARGESRIASYDVSTLGSTGVTLERRRWRALMEKIVKEDYHTMTETEQMDALVLNEQLHTVKFFDLKVGDTVREILQLLQRETGGGSSVNRDTPLHVSPNHPERRV
ncbi:hypothetical protein DQ04_03261020 [Trypanosoma grayi]|uniref:hypothetical protein n=1 Tax=Trypanosoma grayi TaxID=71804 RepID=UPI0004F4AFB3|nr:hypothetical protein DQ04_03261020 [Trypanosoma grayi]KEG10816.1 hypothetical protein DQ04_03261020 [Trypanosoma grayi]